VCVCERARERERERERQRDRETERQRQRQTDRDRDGERETDRQTEINYCYLNTAVCVNVSSDNNMLYVFDALLVCVAVLQYWSTVYSVSYCAP